MVKMELVEEVVNAFVSVIVVVALLQLLATIGSAIAILLSGIVGAYCVASMIPPVFDLTSELLDGTEELMNELLRMTNRMINLIR
jgi:hypothetical protein